MNMQETHCMSNYWFLNNICVMGEMSEKWKTRTVIPIHKGGEKQKVGN